MHEEVTKEYLNTKFLTAKYFTNPKEEDVLYYKKALDPHYTLFYRES